MDRNERSAPTSRGRLSWRSLLVAGIVIVASPIVAAWALPESDRTIPLAPGGAGGFHPVAGEFESDGTTLEGCKAEDYACLGQALGNVAFERGPKHALAVLEHRIASDDAVERGCHPIAHMIGSAALARFDGNVAQTFAEGGATCASGYYHGVLERAFAGITTRRELAATARTLCADDSMAPRGFLVYQCDHGLGHGLMIQTGYNLPLALSVCDGLATRWDQAACTGGIFMENISTGFGFRSRWVKEDDLVYPCNWVAPRHKHYCYLRVTTRILEETDYDWEQAASTCNEIEHGWAALCFQSYGRDVSAQTRQKPAEILRLCRAAGVGEGDCLHGAARTVADTYARGEEAAALCHLAPTRHRDRCFSGLGTVLGLLHPTSRGWTAACADVARSAASACAEGARSAHDVTAVGA